LAMAQCVTGIVYHKKGEFSTVFYDNLFTVYGAGKKMSPSVKSNITCWTETCRAHRTLSDDEKFVILYGEIIQAGGNHDACRKSKGII